MTLSGTIFDIKKFAIHDGPGIRTTVFFKGCPLNCWWCHNPEGLKAELETLSVRVRSADSNSPHADKKEIVGHQVTVETVMEEIEKDVIFYDQSGGGVTLSGGEPLMQEEFLCALLEACKSRRINTAVDTSGYARWTLFERISGLVDEFLYDLKLIDDEYHSKYAGVSNELILENLRKLSEKEEKVIVRIPMIPGITDTGLNLEAIIGFLAPLKSIREIDLLPYNKLAEDKFKKFNMTSKLGQLPAQTEMELNDKAELFRVHGYSVKIGG
ncbi:MAG: glycyl-radical enzyme activating protein [Candidatus Latescibacteria bacterium]|nr:glycyl-radical enzyme activating protein [Candidatus Latescibacterota bacterium]NIO28439.1 glycyl-radical enzyme activating protein [Candidatus Latescibacterota bacterium]NIO55988.1 glycyl-radical enzyme activating protein [Candidatus Latescibacterota bacterium]NIT01952.1 glycyl-radical enzyme activating protein [Candidatus Latescibacterota bacterium]